jgi:hypothetical protein
MGKRKRKKKAGKKVLFPRLAWSRSPVQRPHSTKKGAKGYDRKRLKREDEKEAEESE